MFGLPAHSAYCPTLLVNVVCEITLRENNMKNRTRFTIILLQHQTIMNITFVGFVLGSETQSKQKLNVCPIFKYFFD